MIYRNDIVFVDRDGDTLSVGPRTSRDSIPDPVMTVTHGIRKEEWDQNTGTLNTGKSQSVVFTEAEFRSFMKEAWERVLGEPFPTYNPPFAG